MRFITLQILALMLGTIFNVFAGPPEPEEGERWVRNDQYSDEFNDTQLNTNKWKNTFSGWKGRQPGYFDPAAVSVNGGNMVIRNHPGVPSGAPSGYTLSGGAVQSTTEDSHFGYYECNFKASRVNMSTTFWLSSSGRDELRTADNNDTYSQELDICESIGGAGNFSSDFRTKMKFNTHYRNRADPWPTAETFYSKGNNQVEIRDGDLVGGDASLQTSESWEDYHTYACNWRSAQDAQFFVDDRFIGVVTFRTDVVSDPFKDPMRINLVTETYNWAKPYPTDEELNNNNINASYYNWVRTYVNLPVDQASNLDDEGATIFTEEANFSSAYAGTRNPASVYDFVLLYKANVDREMNITIKDSNGNVVKSVVSAALSGYGKKRYTVALDSPLAEGTYTVTSELKNGSTVISSDVKGLIIQNGVIGDQEAVDFVTPPSTLASLNQYTFDINYITNEARDVIVEVKNSEDVWLGNVRVNVPQGTGTTTATINLTTALPIGTGYKLNALLVPTGLDWQAMIENASSTFDVEIPVVEDVALINTPVEVQQSNSYTFEFSYTTAEARDVIVEVKNSANAWLGNVRVNIPKGTGVASGTITFANDLPLGTGYKLSAFMVPVGLDWKSIIVDNNAVFDVALITGVNDYYTSKITVFPNPTNGIVHLSKSSEWTLYNLLGEVIENGSGTTISLADQKQGVYWVSIGTNRHKIVKQ